jgi:hypothetical protein
VRLDSEVIHYEWDWDPITFLEPDEFIKMSTVVHHLKELKLRHPALSDLQYFAQLNSTRQWHGQSISFLGLGLSSIGGNLGHHRSRHHLDHPLLQMLSETR